MTPAEIRERLGAGLDLESLGRAFERFTASAEVLEEQQTALRERIAALDIELAEANDQLSQSLAAQSALSTDLHNVLENLSAGVVAIDTEGCVRTVNGAAIELLGQRSAEDLIGRQVVVVRGFAPIRVGGFRSDVLVLGALTDDGVVLLAPDTEVPPGSRIA